MNEWKQDSFKFLPMYQKSKWMFTCLCWSCLRILDVPAGVFLQGDPVCTCGATCITGNFEARAMMEELQHLSQNKPLIYEGKKIIAWTKKDGAKFES